MKKLESTLLNMTVVLTSVSIVAAALLGFMHEITKEPIAQIEKENLNNGIKKVILGSAEDATAIEVKEETKDAFTLYHATDSKGVKLGTAVKTAIQGFSPDLTVLVGFDNSGNILGYEVLKHGETPGLGANVNTWFQKGNKGDIIGKNPGTNNLTVKKDGGEVDAITASTITSRAFLKAVKLEYDAVFGGAVSATTGATATAAPADTTSVVAE